MDTITVSIVEDNTEIREGLKTLLNESKEFRCITACSSAEDALNTLAHTNSAVIIMDINLPGISGTECVKKLTAKGCTSQFMMFTVHDDDETIFEALKAGAAGYLLKNTAPAVILKAIAELHRGGSPMSAQVARKVVAAFRGTATINKEADVLTVLEKEILDLLAKGFLYKEISIKLSISIDMVKQHIHTIYKKLHVNNRTEAINKTRGQLG